MIAVNLGRVEKDEVFNRESNVVREKHVQGEIRRASFVGFIKPSNVARINRCMCSCKHDVEMPLEVGGVLQ
jgi:hypothetical protein